MTLSRSASAASLDACSRNSSATRRTQRAVVIEQRAGIAPTTETIGTATLTADPDENRVLLAFPARLSREHYRLVRQAGFVWSPTRSAFVRKLTPHAMHIGRELASRIAEQAPTAQAEG
jgi:hypothetical protein